MKSVIKLPNGRRVGLKTYVSAWRMLKQTNPNRLVSGFNYHDEEAGFILRKIKDGVQDRINQRISWYNKGRKWQSDWFYEVKRVNDQLKERIIVHDGDFRPLDKSIQRRIRHRVHFEGDF